MSEFINNVVFDPTVAKIVSALFGILVIQALSRLFQRITTGYIQDNSFRYSIRKLIGFSGHVISFFFVLAVFSNQLGSLTVAFGVAGAGIAFALQEVIASLAGWIAISLGQYYRVGDRVQLGGIKGDVIDIGMVRTTLMEMGEWVKGDLYNGRIVRIANSFVFKEPVFNYSSDFPFVWDEIVVPIKFGSDYALANEILLASAQDIVGEYTPVAHETWRKMIEKYLIEEASVEPMIDTQANDNWVEYYLRYVVDFKKRRSTKDKIFKLIVSGIEQTGGRVGLASATFHLVETPTFKVQFENKEPGSK